MLMPNLQLCVQYIQVKLTKHVRVKHLGMYEQVERHFFQTLYFLFFFNIKLRWYLTLQGDNSLKSVERFNHMFACRFQASR